uniref:Clathrin binding box of aftiphilin containing 1 n=1 Tax=Sphenodon punctatus TaxID=8508 RepID=A0A8D0H565_SPHPU
MSLKDLTAEAGGMSVAEINEGTDERNTNEGRNKEETDSEMIQGSLPAGGSGEGFHDSTPETDTLEPSSACAWGDFECFSEPLVTSENFSPSLEALTKSAKSNTSKNNADLNEELCTTSYGQHCSKMIAHNGREATVNPEIEASPSYKDIFEQSFPKIPIPHFSESISSLDHILDTNSEDFEIPEYMKKQLCIDSGNIWKMLRHSNSTSGLSCPWNKFHCQKNLLSILGIDANQKDHAKGSSNDVLEETNIQENEDLKVDEFNISNCKALIQTKLSVPPDSRHGRLFSYNLFLKKTPSNGNMQYITIPRTKRIFTTQNLKMKIFNTVKSDLGFPY